MKKAGNAIMEGGRTAGLFIYDKTKMTADKVAEKGKEIAPAFEKIGVKTKEGFLKMTNTISTVPYL